MKDYIKKLVEDVKKEFPNVVLEQVFSGHIKEIDANTAFVHLYDQTNEGEDLTAEMEIDSFPKDPLYPTLTPGVIFYWYIGYEGEISNTFSLIRLSQAVWTQEMIEKARLEAEKLKDLF